MGKLDSIIKKHIVLTALSGFAVVLLMITITYGLYQTNHENTTDQEISLGDFDVDLTSTSGQITLSDLTPGVENSATYTFTTSNSGDYVVKYSVYFTDNTTTFLADQTNAQTYANYTQITSENYEFIEYKLDDGEYKPLTMIYNSTDNIFTFLGGRLYPTNSYTHNIKFRVSPDAPNTIQGSILALNITMNASVVNANTAVDDIMKQVEGYPTNSYDVIQLDSPDGATCDNKLAFDKTFDNNLRYVGSNPCNYVNFNGETNTWRIIGVMNNIDDGNGNLETRLKIVRTQSLGQYSWDTSENSVNYGYGINDWSQADLMQELNGDYLDTTLSSNTYWYSERNNAQSRVYDYTKGIQDDYQNLIGNAKWYLGVVTSGIQENFIPSKIYGLERGITPLELCEDSFCPRSLEWTGKIGLMYASDYGFATSAYRPNCVNIYSMGNNSIYDDNRWSKNLSCRNQDWLYIANNNRWLITPGEYYDEAWHIDSTGNISHTTTNPISKSLYVQPTFYLKSDVKITSGDGSAENPYTLGL